MRLACSREEGGGASWHGVFCLAWCSLAFSTSLSFMQRTVFGHNHRSPTPRDSCRCTHANRQRVCAQAWAWKELVLNTFRQTLLVRQGLGDVEGVAETLHALAGLPDSQGWQQLQAKVRGAREIDAEAWRAATDHRHEDVGSDDAAAAADVFWELVAG